MASSPVTAPSPPENSTNSPPPSPGSSSPPPPPPSDNSSPPPPQNSPPPSSSPSPPPPPAASPPPKASPPPPLNGSNSPPPPPLSPPPPQSNNLYPQSPPPPPPPQHSKSPPSSGSSPPPPHAPLHKTPPASHKSGNTDGSSSSNDSMSDKIPTIVGVTAVVVVLLIASISIFVCCVKKKKRRKDPIPYYMDPSRGPKAGGDYYGSHSQRANWQNGPSGTDNMGNMGNVPLPPGAPPGGGWFQPPPPPMISSSEMSSGFSGPRLPVLPPPSPNIALGFNKSTFSYDELATATNGFSQANLLGQGGFGFVHKGVLPNGKVIAVKSLKSGSGQGEREFQAEVEIISRVHHRYLVSLVGYCIGAGGQRMLVYEFVPNNTLEYHLHGSARPVMPWSKRLTIALGSAKGLAYLHEDCHPRIIHRDIKAANILLDDNFEAMVADFGLAKLSSDTYTHVSTRVMGTFGYLAPEYASSGKLTEKSDVFSFGVMLLELITGKRPVDPTSSYMEDSLVDWARPLLTRSLGDGNYDGLADPMLEGNYDHAEMARMVACAAASIRHSAKRRPKMSQIVRALEGDVSLDDLNEGVRPGSSSQFASSSDYDSGAYNADMKKFRKMALGTQEYDSSEYSGQTSEFGVNASSTSGSDATNSREMK